MNFIRKLKTRFDFRSFRVQLAIMFMAFITILTTFVVLYTRFSIENRFLPIMETVLVDEAKLVKYSIEPLLASNIKKQELEDLVKQIGTMLSKRITVIMEDGKVIADTSVFLRSALNQEKSPEINQAFLGKTGKDLRVSEATGEKTLYVAISVIKNNKNVAAIRVATSVTNLQVSIDYLSSDIFLWVLIISLIGFSGAFFITTKWNAALASLKTFSQLVLTGNFLEKLPSLGVSEMNSLAHTMNEMGKELTSRFLRINEQEQEIRTVLANLQEAVIAIDLNKRIIRMNIAAEKYFKVSSSGVRGKLCSEVITSEQLIEIINKLYNAQIKTTQDAIIIKSEERYYKIYCELMNDSELNPVGALLVMYDVTSIKMLETIKRDFVANVSHEFKTPLTSLRGFIETLLDLSENNIEIRERFLRISLQQVESLEALVSDLLSLAYLEHEDGNERLDEFCTLEIENNLQEIIDLYQLKAKENQIVIINRIINSVSIFAHPILFEQAITNLLDNAIRYSSSKNPIEIIVSQDNKHLIIAVKDYGVGISEKDQQRIFERFFRIDKSRSKALGGTGLGLAIVKHIMEIHKGECSVESKPGEGSTFYLKFRI